MGSGENAGEKVGRDNNGDVEIEKYVTRLSPNEPHMQADKEAISLSRIHSYYSTCNLPLI